MVVTSSGRDVPSATMVRPMTICDQEVRSGEYADQPEYGPDGFEPGR
jgi:hypothetical protein